MEQDFLENELIILTKATLDRFLKEENPSDLIALYTFFYYTAKWQKTNIVKATQGYVKRGLGWGIARLTANESKLVEMGLIEKIQRKDSKGKITGWFIKVNYILKQENVDKVQMSIKPQVDASTCGNGETNALSTNNINALSTNKEYITLPKERGTTPSLRLMTIYKDCFRFFYGFDYKPNFGRDLKTFKELTTSYSELQIARMITVFFNWYGMTGNDTREYDFVSKATFSISLFKSTATKYEAYCRNILREDFDDDSKLLVLVGKHITNLKS